MALARNQITLIDVNDGYVGGDGKSYVLNILGGQRSIVYDQDGTGYSPAPTSFTAELVVNGTVVAPATYAWSAQGHLSGTGSGASFTPSYAASFNNSLSVGDAVFLTVTYNGMTIRNAAPIAVSKIGTNGVPTYTWIRYADAIDGTGINNDPAGKAYIGFAHNKLSPTESNLPEDYTWSLVKGPQGDRGNDGDPAKTLSFVATTQVLKSPSTGGETTPAWAVVTAELVNTTEVTWTYSSDGGSFSSTRPSGVGVPSGNSVVVTGEDMVANTITIKGTSNGASDTITIAKVIDGEKGDPGNQGPEGPKGNDAYTVILSNESHAFPGTISAAIAGSTYFDIIAYKGATRVGATVGTITGTTANVITTTITNNGATNVRVTVNVTTSLTSGGILTIPITVDGKVFTKIFTYTIAFKGTTGKGITSSEISYQAHTSGTSVPGGTWEPNIPTVSPDQYLWTRTVLTYSEGPPSTSYSVGKMGKAGADGNGVTSTLVQYQVGTSGTVAPTGNWIVNVPNVPEGNFLWTKTTINYATGDPSIAYSVARAASNGLPGRGITATTIEYASSTSGVTPPATGWGAAVPTVNPSNFLWTKTTTTYSSGDPTVSYSVGGMGKNGIDGKGITSTSLSYQASASGTTIPSTWDPSIPTVTQGQYLWTRTTFNYTSGTPTYSYSVARMGNDAKLVKINASATIFKSPDGGANFSPNSIVLTPTFQGGVTYSNWQVSTNGGSTWVTAAGQNGVTIASGVLTLAKTSTLFTVSITSLVFKVNTSDAAVSDTITISKLYDVVDLSQQAIFDKLTGGGVNEGLFLSDGKVYINGTYIRTSNLVAGSAMIQNGYLNTAVIENGTITTAKIGDLQVDNAKIANGAIDNIKIQDAAIDNAKIQNASIEHGKIKTLDASKITVGTIKDVLNKNSISMTDGTFSLGGGKIAYNGTALTINVDTLSISSAPVATQTYASTQATSAQNAAIAAAKTYSDTKVANTQTAVFNALTNGGANQGIYLSGGNLYINGTYIQAGAINANLITAGKLSADRIQGGTLTMGGSSNGNGLISIKDSSNREVMKLDKDGLIIDMYYAGGGGEPTNQFLIRDGVSKAELLKIGASGELYYAGPAYFNGGVTSGTGDWWSDVAGHSFHNTNGYISLGPMNSSHAHIYTDRPTFYFNKGILVNGTAVSLSDHGHSTLAGMSVTTAATGNTIVARNVSGYIYATYFNSDRGDENNAAASYIYDNGDGWMRKKSLATVRSEIVNYSTVQPAIRGGMYVSSGFYLHTSSASGKYVIFDNSVSGSQGSEPVIRPSVSGGWGGIGATGAPWFKGYSYGWVNSSDKNLKGEIVPFSGQEGYDLVKDLKFYSYRYYKGDKAEGDLRWEHSLGIVSQEAPYEIKSYAQDGTSEEAIDLYSYATLLGVATQEMQKKVEVAEERANTLENTVAELQEKLTSLTNLVQELLVK